MKAVLKYGAFIIILAVIYLAAISFELPFIGSANVKKAAARKTITGPILSGKPSVVLSGLGNTASSDYSPGNNLAAGGGAGAVKLWSLPVNLPVLDINPGEDFQVLAVRFLQEKGLLATGGATREDTGSIRIFNTASGGLVRQIDDPEPIIALDVHPAGRYLLATGQSYVTIWDLKDRIAAAVIPKTTSEAKGSFFMDGRYVVLSDSLALYDWSKKEGAGALDSGNLLLSKKVNDNMFAWISAEGLSIVHAPHGKREFIPFSTTGIIAFDIAPNAAWGLFLKVSGKMDVIDLEDGKVLKTIDLNPAPIGLSISSDGSSVMVIRQSGNIDVFDIGSANAFRNIKFKVSRFFESVKNKIALMRSKDKAAENGI